MSAKTGTNSSDSKTGSSAGSADTIGDIAESMNMMRSV
jgi:hypothetical protein